MNKINIFGRFTKDPEISKSSGGADISKFNIACKGSNKDKEGNIKVNFFNCIAFNERAKTIGKFCKKGDLVNIFGYMESSTYEKDGKKSTSWNCVIDSIEFATTKADREKSVNKQEDELDF